MIDPDRFRVAILIVSFRNPQDVQTCLTALSRSTEEPGFDIFVCENGGRESFRELCDTLMGSQGPCIPVSDDLPDSLVSPSGRLVEVKCFALKDRPSRVRRRRQCLDRPIATDLWLGGNLDSQSGHRT